MMYGISIFSDLGGEKRGQSLIEVLIAVFIGILLFVAAASIIAPVLKTNSEVARGQIASSLAKQLMEHVVAFAGSNWHAIDGSLVVVEDLSGNQALSNLVPGNPYHLTTTTSPFVLKSGEETLTVGTTTYMRSFSIQDVYRKLGKLGEIVPSSDPAANLDPSIKKVTASYSWPGSALKSFSRYIARTRNNVLVQTDWSGGDGQSLVTTSTMNNKFWIASSSIEYASSVGSLVLLGVGVPPPPPGVILRVSAVNGAATIEVDPVDLNGKNITDIVPPPFDFAYSSGEQVILTAPVNEQDGGTFDHWIRDGSAILSSNPIMITANVSTTMTAFYLQ